MPASASSLVHVRRWALILGLVAALVLQATPAFAGTATLTVDRVGFRWGGITDDLGAIDCQDSAPCSGSYPQSCETDGDGPVLCEPVEVVLTTTLPTGFTAAWTNCAESTATTCRVVVGSATNINTAKTVTVQYTDVQDPTLSLLAPSEGRVYTTSVPTWAFPNDNDQVQRVRFTFTPPDTQPIEHDDFTAPYAPVLNTAGLPDGAYTVTARSYDRTGRASPLVTRNVIVDRVAPELTVTGPGDEAEPGPWLRGGAARSWTFEASDATSGVASIRCAEDDVVVACSGATSHSLTPAAGAHKVAVTATDAGGNATTETRYFQVDDTAPALSLKSPRKDATIRDNTPTFAPAASDPESGIASVTCRIGSGETQPCSEFAPTLADGTHTLTVRATNGAGMVRKISRTFTVDATAPVTVITKGPGRPFAAAPGAAFRLGADEPGATFTCRLDGAPFTGCTSPQKYAGLSAGTHLFNARATDAVGNVDRTPAKWMWTVPHDDRDLSFGSGWAGLSNSKFFRGTALRAREEGATLVRKGVRARRLALVATTCSDCGSVDVYHGATRLKRVRLQSDTTRNRQVFLLKTYDALSDAASIRIAVVSDGKNVIIDGLGIATR